MMTYINKNEFEFITTNLLTEELNVMNNYIELFHNARTKVKKTYLKKKIDKIRHKILYLMQSLNPTTEENLNNQQTDLDEEDAQFEEIVEVEKIEDQVKIAEIFEEIEDKLKI